MLWSPASPVTVTFAEPTTGATSVKMETALLVPGWTNRWVSVCVPYLTVLTPPPAFWTATASSR